jgi:Uma2 family endonuclease
MNLHTPRAMTVDEYLVWARGRPGRYELIRGAIREMSPETSRHADAKVFAYMALRAAIKRAQLPFIAKPDGMTVRVAKDTAFESDALVYAEPRVGDDEVEIPDPVIIVEVVSKSTRKYDAGFKLQGYMNLSSVQHVLLINTNQLAITHHRRLSPTTFETTNVDVGTLHLDPPGLAIPVADFFIED